MRNYLEDLIGVKRVAAAGETLPQRAAVSFEGAGVESIVDDPANDQLVITFAGEGSELRSITYAGELGDAFVQWFVVHDDLASADLVRVQTAADESTIALKLVGMDPTDLVKTRKVIANVGDTPLRLVSEIGFEPAWFILPQFDVTLPPNGCIEVVWLPTIGASPAGWRLIGGFSP